MPNPQQPAEPPAPSPRAQCPWCGDFYQPPEHQCDPVKVTGETAPATAAVEATAIDRIIGRPDKPFHKPECQCEQCREWCKANPLPASPAAAPPVGLDLPNELRQLFRNRFNCWTQKVSQPDDEIGTDMAMSEDRFVEVAMELAANWQPAIAAGEVEAATSEVERLKAFLLAHENLWPCMSGSPVDVAMGVMMGLANIRSEWAVMARACGNWRTWPGKAECDHDHDDWKAAAAAIVERDTLRSQLAEAKAKLAQARTYVEGPIAGRTKFDGEPPYVGWKGLGLAMEEAFDDRDSLREQLAEARRRIELAGGYHERTAAEIEASEYLQNVLLIHNPDNLPKEDDLLRQLLEIADAGRTRLAVAEGLLRRASGQGPGPHDYLTQTAINEFLAASEKPAAQDELKRLRGMVEGALEAIGREAQQFEDAFNSDDYDGDVDADEQAAEIRWHCVRTVKAALKAIAGQGEQQEGGE